MKKSRRETKEDSHIVDRESNSKTPRWVKVSGIIAIVLVLLVVLIMIVSGGKHGPGRHLPSSIGVEQSVEQQWS
ncbi:hypothetical protein [Sporosarcina highlanderae]|uniref:Uncharacterized protein n=1 Tax=Sporosarcina highlanderae TaxID=3035916 RepID=A0ABT8JTQ0_9BACL|nr:hypothetical protein [Sporosarcina highlanderae]MDN4607936.1 hypothetical protein [Sporosarcina highlanderae]